MLIKVETPEGCGLFFSGIGVAQRPPKAQNTVAEFLGPENVYSM